MTESAGFLSVQSELKAHVMVVFGTCLLLVCKKHSALELYPFSRSGHVGNRIISVERWKFILIQLMKGFFPSGKLRLNLKNLDLLVFGICKTKMIRNSL